MMNEEYENYLDDSAFLEIDIDALITAKKSEVLASSGGVAQIPVSLINNPNPESIPIQRKHKNPYIKNVIRSPSPSASPPTPIVRNYTQNVTRSPSPSVSPPPKRVRNYTQIVTRSPSPSASPPTSRVRNPYSPNKRLRLDVSSPQSVAFASPLATNIFQSPPPYPSQNSRFNVLSNLNCSDDNTHLRETSLPTITQQSLKSTLLKYYGFTKFRPGQLSAITSILQRQDCAIFWKTGSGKSLCYQIPPLMTKKLAIVISPSISLMQDQCNKLNQSLHEEEEGTKIATYLGNNETESEILEKLSNHDYLFLYLTPEKLLSNNASFLDQLSANHPPILFAVDEAHYVFEWGHDIRPEYRLIGQAIRSRPFLMDVPIVALTATASPKIQFDIIDNLKLYHPQISVQNFDRDNLEIDVKRKPQLGGYAKALMPILRDVARKKESTILYVPTIALVEEMTSWIGQLFPELGVRSFHGKIPSRQRNEFHTDFVTGKSMLIVATHAFGMGIDKPDIRNVLHYGAPKTMEEYYRQIGRAGRDNLPAKCIMFVNETDFDRYESEFYMKNFSSEVRGTILASIEALRLYCGNLDKCRRKSLLEYFEQETTTATSFGEWCGLCDVCKDRKRLGEDKERDFAREGARLILTAVWGVKEASKSVLWKVMNGSLMEPYRCNNGLSPEELREEIRREKEEMFKVLKKKRELFPLMDLIPSLVQRGYICQNTKTAKLANNQYSSSWSTYKITPLGLSSLSDTSTPILLPVPPSIREYEAEEEQKRLIALDQLEQSGIDLTKIPTSELDSGEGEILQMHKYWIHYLETLRKLGRHDRVDQLLDLKKRIEKWRCEIAEQFKMAPVAILPDHSILDVAHMTASAHVECPVDNMSLHKIGVRTPGMKQLKSLLKSWIEEMNHYPQTMVFNDHSPFQPTSKWHHAVYKPMKNTGLASWESSYQRFSAGEHPRDIAATPVQGKRTIHIDTVVSHILEALTHGKPVSLYHLSTISTPPNQNEWEELMTAESMLGIDVVEEKNVSLTEFLKFKMGDQFVESLNVARRDEDMVKFRRWQMLAKWYMALRRVGYTPDFMYGLI